MVYVCTYVYTPVHVHACGQCFVCSLCHTCTVQGVLAAVDATLDKDLGERYEVKGYPTIKYFAGGELKYDYGYKREAMDIVDFMREPKEPPPPEKDWTELETEVCVCVCVCVCVPCMRGGCMGCTL